MSGIFDGLEGVGRREKPKRERSITFGACPGCSTEKVGLVRSTNGSHLIWRMHELVTHGGVRMPCGSVGQYLCQCKARQIIGYDAPHCPHEKQ